MSAFDGFSLRYDWGMLPLEWLLLRRLRRRILPLMQGRILELGAGTGVNLPLYEPGVDVLAVDLSEGMLRQARHRRSTARVRYIQADVQALPFAAGSFSQVFTSLLFCSVAEPLGGLSEIRRVLEPGGWLMMLEHVRGQHGLMRWLTDWLERPWHHLSKSCHLNRDTESSVSDAGFQLVCSSRHLFGVVQIIVARRPA